MPHKSNLPLPVMTRMVFTNAGVRFRQRVSPNGSYYYEFSLDGQTRLLRVSDHPPHNKVFTWPPDYDVTERKVLKRLAKDLKRMKRNEAWNRLVGQREEVGDDNVLGDESGEDGEGYTHEHWSSPLVPPE